MKRLLPIRRAVPACCGLACVALACAAFPALAQAPNPAEAPASVPAGTESARTKPVSAKQAREADDAYLKGAKEIAHSEYQAAEKDFAHAAELDPGNSVYVRAFGFARENRVTELLHQAAVARHADDAAKADALLKQAHALDPDNRFVNEHLDAETVIHSATFDPMYFPAANIGSTLAGAIDLKPAPGVKDLHASGDPQSVLRTIYGQFGIKVQFDSSYTPGKPVRFDLDGATFRQAASLLGDMTHTFAVPVDAHLALIAANTQENRDRLTPQLEETLYIPGSTNDQLQELANLARTVFQVKSITASASSGTLLIRADEPTMKLLNAEYADMVDGGSDVLLDVTLYEVDRSKTRNLGVTFPSGASAFPLAYQLQTILSQNASVLSAAQSSGLLTLNGTTLQNDLTEIEFLYAGGYLSSSQISEITGLLGTVGQFSGLPFLGVSIASGATLNALLQSSEARVVDAVQLRAGTGQAATFRSGTRYPIETAIYSSGVSSAASAALAGVSINGTSASQLLSQYLGTQVSVPQIDFEDLGLTLKATPIIQRNDEVHIALDLKIEALGTGSLNGIPVLNHRQLTSTVTVPDGQTAMLVSQVNQSELGSVSGFPGLNELPGFSGTDKETQKSDTELLITITPHVVRQEKMHIASRRVLAPRTAAAGGS